MSGRYYLVDGKTLWVEDEGQGYPVLLLHGLTLDGGMWEPQLPALTRHYRVIRPDFCGAGQSDDPTKNKKYSNCDHLNKLLAQMNIDSAHTVGLSRGGRAALKFSISHPHRVASLVIIDTSLRLKGTKIIGHDEIQKETIELMELGKWPEARKKWQESHLWRKMPNGKLHPLLERILDDCFARKHRWDLADRNDGFDAAAFHRINVQTLVMRGAEETEEIQNDAQLLRDSIRNSQLVIVPDAGHMANIDNSEFVNTQLLSFLRRFLL